MSRSPRLRWGALVVLAAGAACARAEHEASLGRQTSAIQGGVGDATSTFAVAVLDPTNETCSGTLIAPNLVLTARHCISDDSGGAFVDCAVDEFTDTKPASRFRVSTAADASFADAPYAVAKILVPNDAEFCGNDIALLVLAQSIASSEAKPATPALDPNNAKYGDVITAIGFGTTEPGGNDDGSRRRRSGVPIVCLPNDGSDCEPSDYQMTASELAAGDGLCEGDSGSGAYLPATLTSGSPVVIGVLSRASDDGSSCIDAIFTRTDAFGSFLEAGAIEAAAAGGYDAPAWATTSVKPDAATPTERTPDAPEEEAPSPEATATTAEPADSGCSVGRRARRDVCVELAGLVLALALGARRRRC